MEIEISFTKEDLSHQFYLEIAHKYALADGIHFRPLYNMVTVVAESGSQVVKHEIWKIVKRSDHGDQVKFIVRICGLVGRDESIKYTLLEENCLKNHPN